MDIKLSDREKVLYFKEIKKEITFLKRFNSRADYEFYVDGLTLDKIPQMLIEFLIDKNDEFKQYIKNNSGFF